MQAEFKGQLIFVVGNSGSGKDSLLKEALKMWPHDQFEEIKIPHRYITRPPHETEPFISINEEEYHKMKAEGKFCLTWHIYDLYYGVPIEIEEWLKKGDLVIVNVSRKIIDKAKQRYPGLKVVFVSVPFEITLERIKSRGREDENDPVFKKRVERAKTHQTLPDADFIVENIGSLEENAPKLRDYLIQFAKPKKK